jgi:hypothetical protein
MPDTLAPRSVRYARALLKWQAAIWAIGTIGGVIVTVLTLAGRWPDMRPLVAVAVGGLVFAGGIAAAKLRLANRLGRGRSQRARRAAIAAELAMTCFGVLWVVSPYSGPGAVLAGFAGAVLSLAAALGLMRRSARNHAASGAVSPEVTDQGSASGPMSFSSLQPVWV